MKFGWQWHRWRKSQLHVPQIGMNVFNGRCSDPWRSGHWFLSITSRSSREDGKRPLSKLSPGHELGVRSMMHIKEREREKMKVFLLLLLDLFKTRAWQAEDDDRFRLEIERNKIAMFLRWQSLFVRNSVDHASPVSVFWVNLMTLDSLKQCVFLFHNAFKQSWYFRTHLEASKAVCFALVRPLVVIIRVERIERCSVFLSIDLRLRSLRQRRRGVHC